jgi:hypothetical protein
MAFERFDTYEVANGPFLPRPCPPLIAIKAAAAQSEWLLQMTSVRWVGALLVALAVSAVVARRTIERKAHPLSRMLASPAKL